MTKALLDFRCFLFIFFSANRAALSRWCFLLFRVIVGLNALLLLPVGSSPAYPHLPPFFQSRGKYSHAWNDAWYLGKLVFMHVCVLNFFYKYRIHYLIFLGLLHSCLFGCLCFSLPLAGA